MESLQTYARSFEVSNICQWNATLSAEEMFKSYPRIIIEFLAFLFI
jgi:hypothetical protein